MMIHPKLSCNSGVVYLIDCLLNWTLFCQNPGFGTLRFGPLRIFSIWWNFKYIFLSSRYIDSGHYCLHRCWRPKAGSIPRFGWNTFVTEIMLFEGDNVSRNGTPQTSPLGTNYHQNSHILCSECLLRNIYTALEHLVSLMSRERQLTCAAKKVGFWKQERLP